MPLNFDPYPLMPIRFPRLSPYFKYENGVIVSLDTTIEFAISDLCENNGLNKIFEKKDFSELDNAQDVLNFMAENGMITEELDHGEISSVKICHDLFHAVNKEIADGFNDSNFIHQLSNANVTHDQIIEWLKKCFLYTLSAEKHITGVVTNPNLNTSERVFWKSFLDDEKYHWKMYTQVFQYLGIDISQMKVEYSNSHVDDFINFLFKTGKKSAYAYAALLYMMEIPPDAKEVEDDPQFGTLINSYGFPKSVILPLWNHACYNSESTHSQIWYNVLRSRRDYTQQEYHDIISNCKKHCELATIWNKASC